jgi:putative transposase
MDEARFGLKTWYHRRWCPKGHRPPRVHKKKYEWLWLLRGRGAGDRRELLSDAREHLDETCFEVFLRKLQEAYPDDQIVLVMDRAGSHQNKSVEWPEDIRPLRLPPRSPELNPAERRMRGLRRR